jgi:hypothetical protein
MEPSCQSEICFYFQWPNDNGLSRRDGSSGEAGEVVHGVTGFNPSGSSFCSLRSHHGLRVGLGVVRGVAVPVGLITIVWGFTVAVGSVWAGVA